jgi:hypothetical protein
LSFESPRYYTVKSSLKRTLAENKKGNRGREGGIWTHTRGSYAVYFEHLVWHSQLLALQANACVQWHLLQHAAVACRQWAAVEVHNSVLLDNWRARTMRESGRTSMKNIERGIGADKMAFRAKLWFNCSVGCVLRRYV